MFRGSRLGDGHDTLDGMAFVFPDADSVMDNFALFHDLLSYSAVSAFRYRAFFQEAEGRPIRVHEFQKPLRSPESRRLLQKATLSADIEKVMVSFFRRLSGDTDPDLLAKCFVVTRESDEADERLVRVAEDIAHRIRSIDTASAGELTELVERVRATQRNEFVLIIGTKGAGKTTFIDRFFKFILPSSIKADCVVTRVNLADSDGDEASLPSWLNRQLLNQLEDAVFGDVGPTFDDIQGMFFDEYKRRSQGTLQHLYERDKDEFKIDFGRYIEDRREQQPHLYITRLLGHVVRVRKKTPCLVFDNADQFTIEFQERVFQYARSVYEGELSIVIMPITDRTSWQLSKEGALRSFENESLFLPTPSPRTVLERRIAYLEERLADERRQPGRGYFIGRGISLSLDNLTAFAACLEGTFLKTGEVSWWIGNLANRDVRRCLELAKDIVISPHLDVDELVKAYIARSTVVIPPHRIKRAIIRGRYDVYPAEDNKFVRNVFTISSDVDSSPLLALRILQLLRDAYRTEQDDRFITLEQVVDYCRAMAFDTNAVLGLMSELLDAGLCWSYDPTVTAISHVRKVELSPSGYQHLRWGLRDPDYVFAMAQVTPLRDSSVFDSLMELGLRDTRDGRLDQLRVFIDYLIEEDRKYCSVPTHSAYDSQVKLYHEMGKAVSPPS